MEVFDSSIRAQSLERNFPRRLKSISTFKNSFIVLQKCQKMKESFKKILCTKILTTNPLIVQENEALKQCH